MGTPAPPCPGLVVVGSRRWLVLPMWAVGDRGPARPWGVSRDRAMCGPGLPEIAGADGDPVGIGVAEGAAQADGGVVCRTLQPRRELVLRCAAACSEDDSG